jgi:hypothetical protein
MLRDDEGVGLWVWQNRVVEARMVGVFISRSWGRDRQRPRELLGSGG